MAKNEKRHVVTQIDGALVNLPYESPDGLFTVKFSGRFVMVETTFGLEVNYDGYYYLSVGLESMHAGNVKGSICCISLIASYSYSPSRSHCCAEL